MKTSTQLITPLLLGLLFGCDSSYDKPSLSDFEAKVIKAASINAIDCGKVGSQSSEVNTCVSDSFIINMPFYAFYNITGIDSLVTKAVTMDQNNTVTYWWYDDKGTEIISQSICEKPELNPTPYSDETQVFSCEE
ncbi:MAG: hypothetical protein OCD00_09075 [Colwellia sp.]